MKKIVMSDKDILHLAQLAKLKLDKKEVKQYKKQLEETLAYVKNLDELETNRFSSLFSFEYLKNGSFKDGEKNKRHLTQKQLEKNLLLKPSQYFIVKRIL